MYLALSAALVACSREDCGRWEAFEVDPRLRATAFPIAAGLEGTLGDIRDVALHGYSPGSSGTTQDLLASFVDFSRGSCPFIVVGRAGTIRVSKGINEPWEVPELEAVDEDLRGVAYGCWDDDFGVAVGDGGVILVGSSRATQWKPASTPTVRQLNAVATGPEGLATAVGDGGIIVSTLDAGLSWEIIQAPATETLYAIQYENARDQSKYGVRGYIAGASGAILFSLDGLTWERLESGLSEDLRQVVLHADDELNGIAKPYFLGHSRLFTWSFGQQGLTLVHDLRRPLLAITEYGHLFALAEGGILLRYADPYVCDLPHD